MNAETARTFVDTNILLYASDSTSERKNERANEIIESLWVRRNGCLSIQVLQEFFVNATSKLPRPLSSAEASSVVELLSAWEVHRPLPGDILDAITIKTRHGLSFWDSMIVQSALQLGCTTLLTEDLNDGQIFDTVTIRNPFATA